MTPRKYYDGQATDSGGGAREEKALKGLKLDLERFSELNRTRAAEGFKTYKNVPITYWTTALAGELGELCNMIKKGERVANGGIDGGSSYTAASLTKKDLEEEIGGIFIYLDLLSGLLDINLSDAIIETFNSKSEQYEFAQFYTPQPVKEDLTTGENSRVGMRKANAAITLSQFMWKQMLSVEVVKGSPAKGFGIDQDVLLSYLMDFQAFIYSFQPKGISWLEIDLTKTQEENDLLRIDLEERKKANADLLKIHGDLSIKFKETEEDLRVMTIDRDVYKAEADTVRSSWEQCTDVMGAKNLEIAKLKDELNFLKWKGGINE